MDCETTDPDLLRSVRVADDQEAWSRFDRLYRPAIRSHCQKAGLSGSQVDEVVQDCFIKCFRYLPSFDYQPSVGKFRAWLNLVVNQQVAECFRQTLRSEQLKRSYADLIRDFAPRTFDPSREPSGFEYGLLTMAARRARERVNPLHWQLFEAQILEGLNSTAVAERYGVLPVTVRVSSMRVRRVLQQCWREVQDGPF